MLGVGRIENSMERRKGHTLRISLHSMALLICQVGAKVPPPPPQTLHPPARYPTPCISAKSYRSTGDLKLSERLNVIHAKQNPRSLLTIHSAR